MSYLGQEPGQGQAEYFVFTASGSETSVTTADDGRPVSYTVGQVSVYLNGVKLIEGSGKDFVATNGSTIASLAALTASDVVEVVALSAFSPSDTVSAANGGTFSGNVSFGDNNITNVGSLALDSISADGSSITISTDTALAAGVDIETSTTGKIKQKGSFMQSSTHQAMVLGG
tara:strand:- start:602 stop:1120 length:519 start_codon:yes stop_codon:yes gene_type:complete